MFAFRQFITIARLTALEAIRQPLALLLFASVLLLIALMPLILSHTLGESAKFVRDGALALMWVSGLVLGAHLACAALFSEIRRGTVSAVLSKPIQRPLFFMAKFAGIAVVMLAFATGLMMAVLISTRTARQPFLIDWWSAWPFIAAIVGAFAAGGLINYFLRRPFVSNAFAWLFLLLTLAFLFVGLVNEQGHRMAFGALYDFRIVPAGLLITLAILVLAGISVALATRLKTIPTLSICGGLFLLGLLSDYYFGRWAATHGLASFLYRVTPNWQHFWVVDALAGDGYIPFSYVGLSAAYALLYLSGVLLIGVVAFQRMEVKA